MKTTLFLLLLLSVARPVSAQYFYYDDQYYDKDLLFEGGLSLGMMVGVTDVGKKSGIIISPGRYDWGSAKPAFGAYFGAMYKYTFGARLEVTKGAVSASDSRSNVPWVKARNLSFKSNIIEVALTGQFYPLSLLNTETLPDFSPYVLAGLGMFSYYPKALYNDEWIALRQLRTEGQGSDAYPDRKMYGLRAWSLPMGFGLKYEYNHQLTFRFEAVYRLTTTDYIDDASTTYVEPSILLNKKRILLAHRYRELTPNRDLTGRQRASANNNDRFFTIGLKVGYVIGRSKIPVNDVP